MERVRVGAALAPDTVLGTSCRPSRAQRVMNYIDIGKADGARLHDRRPAHRARAGPRPLHRADRVRGRQPHAHRAGGDLRPGAQRDPLEGLRPIDRGGQRRRYGLAAGLYTSNLRERDWDTADRLQAGSVWINHYFNLASGSPFGGFKESGIGSEYRHETPGQ